jgi:hypothetical protein
LLWRPKDGYTDSSESSEDLMRVTTIAAVLAAALAFAAAPAEAAKSKRTVVTPSSRVVMAQRPTARVTVRRRSYLDGGTEVLPGERKFTDYVVPPYYNPLSSVTLGNAYRDQPLPASMGLYSVGGIGAPF